jgi:hypothetical protein
MAQLIGYTLGSMMDPILIAICAASGLLLRSYGGAWAVGCLIIIPLNVALLGAMGESLPPIMFITKPIAIAAWTFVFHWGFASNSRKKKSQS